MTVRSTSHSTSQCVLSAHPLRGGNLTVTREDVLSFGFTSQYTPCEVLTRTFTTSHLSPLKGVPPSARSAAPHRGLRAAMRCHESVTEVASIGGARVVPRASRHLSTTLVRSSARRADIALTQVADKVICAYERTDSPQVDLAPKPALCVRNASGKRIDVAIRSQEATSERCLCVRFDGECRESPGEGAKRFLGELGHPRSVHYRTAILHNLRPRPRGHQIPDVGAIPSPLFSRRALLGVSPFAEPSREARSGVRHVPPPRRAHFDERKSS